MRTQPPAPRCQHGTTARLSPSRQPAPRRKRSRQAWALHQARTASKDRRRRGLAALWGLPTPGGGLPHSVPAQPAGKTPLPTVSPSIAGASSCGSRAAFSNGQKKMLRGTSRQLEVIQPLVRTHLETGAEGTSPLAAPYLLPLHPPISPHPGFVFIASLEKDF